MSDMGALTRRRRAGLRRRGDCEQVAVVTLLSTLLSFKYVAPSQQASARDKREGERGRRVPDTCLSQDEAAFVTWESGLAAGTGPRQI